MEKAISQKDVAKIIGVSTATVSNAFNRPDQLSTELRQRVLSECAKLGYSGPHFAARSLRSGRSDVVCVMLSDTLSYSFSDPMANLLLEGISDVLAENQKQMLLMSSTISSDAQIRAETLPDGFIFYGTPRGSSFDRILSLGKPCVTVDFTYKNLPSLNVDNYGACCELAKAAIRDKNDLVAVIGMRFLTASIVKRLSKQDMSLPSKEITWSRLLGFKAGASDKGVDIVSDNIIHLHRNKPKEAEIAARLLLMQEQRPNLILCMSDVIALAVCRVAQQLNLRIPEDLRVTGFDDIEEARHAKEGLTTVFQNGIEKGREAATMLLEGVTEHRKVPVELRLRGTH
ncbi:MULTISPECIES: LacI family DNA-binding transcriptional regulator [Alteromonadaceae]|jgi:DNA-binding LacI/PurR family transcriptional regulator|uniref:LacI family DNA-binding transcriptional regulator n=1 Tax=Brumicola blandensis TaxID=3075611 RepID=A0AAW8R3L6_9ALTE|nr:MULTISPECIES: LacI family DNA-binding transcriptional regulator [unclassified Alteromonas]MDT0583004.1 LacI family DNA-binding transcriptional regulator [Alteromonas sp. W409]MDT0627309.1 LacI family DNA-binding transcriptional regulator [Alteromonas sp. W364]